MGTEILSSSQRVKLLWHNVDNSMWWHNVEKFDPVSTVLFLLSHKVEDSGDYHTPLGEQEVLPWLLYTELHTEGSPSGWHSPHLSSKTLRLHYLIC